jgi:hypothetical protein
VVWDDGVGPLSATTVSNRSVIWIRGRLVLSGPVTEQVTSLLATVLKLCINLLWATAGSMQGLFVIRTPTALLLVTVSESNVVGTGGGQGLGLHVPLAVKMPEQPVETVIEQTPLTQHDPVDVVVGQVVAAMIGTNAATTARRTNHLTLPLDRLSIDNHSLRRRDARRLLIDSSITWR